MPRDNFSPRTINTTRDRVGGRCSDPNCRVPTQAANAKTLAVVNIGIAAHIHAASPGGPRYNEEMGADARAGYDNAIWLCSNCASKIDRDVAAYSPAVLREWKAQAEARARAELGNRLPQASDAMEQVAMALTGLGAKFHPTAVANVHRAITSQLQTLDPRFLVETTYVREQLHIHLQPQQEVTFSLKVGKEVTDIWSAGFKAAFDYGQKVRLPLQGVSLEGSELLKALVDLPGTAELVFTPVGRPATVKLIMVRGAATSMEDIQGMLTMGRRAARFEGIGYGGLLSVELPLSLDADNIALAHFYLSPRISVWQGMDVRTAPFVDKLFDFLDCIVHAPDALSMRLEINGETVAMGHQVSSSDGETFQELLNFVHYVRQARKLARFLRFSIPIDCHRPFTGEEHRYLTEAVQMVDGGIRFKRDDLSEDPVLTLLSMDNGESINAAAAKAEYSDIKMVYPGQTITVFGQVIELPKAVMTMAPARLRIVSSQLEDGGLQMRIRVERSESFECVQMFETAAPKISA